MGHTLKRISCRIIENQWRFWLVVSRCLNPWTVSTTPWWCCSQKRNKSAHYFPKPSTTSPAQSNTARYIVIITKTDITFNNVHLIITTVKRGKTTKIIIIESLRLAKSQSAGAVQLVYAFIKELNEEGEIGPEPTKGSVSLDPKGDQLYWDDQESYRARNHRVRE